MSNMVEIEKLTRDFSEARETLATRVQHLNDELEAVKRKFLPLIKHAVETAKTRRSKLEVAILAAPGLFQKPRTITVHGVKVGFQKGRGALTWADDAQVVKLIRKHFPEQFEVLVKTTEKPIKSALSQLESADLRKIGVNSIDSDDEVVIKSTDTDIDKLVSKLLDEEKDLEKEAA